MTINDAIEFLYANESSSSYGVGMASSFGSTSRSGNSENRNIITSKNSFNNKFDLHGVTYDDALSLDIIIYNLDGTYIDSAKERSLKKWLLKNNYNWLQFDQPDLDNLQYHCIANSCEMLDVGSYSGGMKISFVCSEPWAFSELKKKTYTTVSGALNFSLNSVIDFDEYIIYPQIEINCLTSGTCSVKNNTTNETMTFTGCSIGETIMIDCASDKLKTSLGTVIIDRWNKNGVSLIEGNNSFTLTGGFKLIMQYRDPIRVGA